MDLPPPVEHIYMTNHHDIYASNSYLNKTISELDHLNTSRSHHSNDDVSYAKETRNANNFNTIEPPLEITTSSQIAALMILNGRKWSLNESMSTSGHSSYEGGVQNLSKKSSSHRSNLLLEQTKSRSWANLSGYNSSTGRKSSNKKQAAFSRNDYLDLEPSKIDRPVHTNLSAVDDPYRQCFEYARRNKRTAANATELESLSSQLKSMGEDVSQPFDRHDELSSSVNTRDELSRSNDRHDELSRHNYSHYEYSQPVGEHEVLTDTNFLPPEHKKSSLKEGKSMLVTPSRRNSKVKFSTIEVRQYERILGDNPGVSHGPPLSIGWEYYEERTICVPVDEYEYYHVNCEDLSDVVLNRYEREAILHDLGYDEIEIAKIVRQNYKLKKKRRQTVNNLPNMQVEQVVESAKKSLIRMLTFSAKEQRSSKTMYRKWKKNMEDGLFSDTASCNTVITERSILKTAPSSGTLDGIASSSKLTS